ncbi:MAG TPA: hypothetical protein VII82_06015 [Polyangiaceae bacterium]|jgi:hypothetical protein
MDHSGSSLGATDPKQISRYTRSAAFANGVLVAAPDVMPGSDAPAETSTEASKMEASIATDGGDTSVASVLPALPGYTVSVWTTGGAYTQPDSIELDGNYVWVGYQMGVIAKDRTDAGGPLNSKVVQYNLGDGSLTGKSFTIPGHCDGVRVDPSTHIVWATSNEDGNRS